MAESMDNQIKQLADLLRQSQRAVVFSGLASVPIPALQSSASLSIDIIEDTIISQTRIVSAKL